MKRKIEIISAIIILFLATEVHCQVTGDEMQFLIKLTLYQESSGTKYYKSNEESLIKFMRLEFDIDTLEASGFDDFIFFTINPIYKNPDMFTLTRASFSQVTAKNIS